MGGAWGTCGRGRPPSRPPAAEIVPAQRAVWKAVAFLKKAWQPPFGVVRGITLPSLDRRCPKRHPNDLRKTRTRMKYRTIITNVSMLLCGMELSASDQPAPKGWPSGIRLVKYAATADGSMQPMLLNWLAMQRRGQSANWDVTVVHDLKTKAGDSDSGK